MEPWLEKWKRFAWFCPGMSVSLLAASIADLFLYPHGVGENNYLVWLLLWLSFQSVTAVPSFILVRGKDRRPVPESLRFHTIFEFFAADWMMLPSFGAHLEIRFFPVLRTRHRPDPIGRSGFIGDIPLSPEKIY